MSKLCLVSESSRQNLQHSPGVLTDSEYRSFLYLLKDAGFCVYIRKCADAIISILIWYNSLILNYIILNLELSY
jgi:hypothetical protein